VTREVRGFTLIELLVVIAIIAILAAILFPVFMEAQRKGQESACLGNMNQISKAIFLYADDNGGYSPMAFNKEERDYNTWDTNTWRQRIAPFIKSKKVFYCPIKTKSPQPLYYLDQQAAKFCHYGMNVYINYTDDLSHLVGYRLLSSIPQASKTILVTENKDGDWSGEPWNNASTGDAGQFYPYHGSTDSKGGIFVFSDGHTSFMSVAKTQQDNFFYWKVIK